MTTLGDDDTRAPPAAAGSAASNPAGDGEAATPSTWKPTTWRMGWPPSLEVRGGRGGRSAIGECFGRNVVCASADAHISLVFQSAVCPRGVGLLSPQHSSLMPALRPRAWRVLALTADPGGASALAPLAAADGASLTHLAGADVTPEAAAEAVAQSRPNLIYVGAGAGQGGATLAALPPALVAASAAATTAAAPDVDAVWLDGMATSIDVEATVAGDQPHVLYWPADGGGVSGAGARVHARALATALAPADAPFPEAVAVAACALRALGGGGGGGGSTEANGNGGAPSHSVPSPTTITIRLPPRPDADPASPRSTVVLASPRAQPATGDAAASSSRAGLPALLSAHAPALPSIDTVPAPPSSSSSSRGDIQALGLADGAPGAPKARLLAPPARVCVTPASGSALAATPAAAAALADGLRAALVTLFRRAIVTATEAVTPPPAATPRSGGVALRCALSLRGVRGALPVVVVAPAGVVDDPAILELVVRLGLVADALSLQVVTPLSPPAITLSTSLPCGAALRCLAADPVGGGNPLAALGVAAVDGAPVASLRPAVALDAASLAAAPPPAPPAPTYAPPPLPLVVELTPLAGPDVPPLEPPDRAVAAAAARAADAAPGRAAATPFADASLNGTPLDVASLAAAVDAAGGATFLAGDADAWAATVLPRVGGAPLASRQPGADADAVRRAYERWVAPLLEDRRSKRRRR